VTRLGTPRAKLVRRSDDTQPAASPRWVRLLLGSIPVVLAVPLLLWHASYFMPYMADDSLIVARYAERLIEGHGLTWTDGERVEGYSNLLWTVSVAAIAALGIDVLDAARLLGVLCMTAVFVALSRAYAPRTLAEVVPPTIAALLFASAGPVAVWAIGGLEQSMVAALLAWALVAVFPIIDSGGGGGDGDGDESSRRALLVGLPLGLLCWTRPDGPLFTAVFAGVTVVLFQLRRTGWLLALRMTVLPIVAVAMQLGFRLIYYGDWLPNPAYIKARVARGERLASGVEYVVGAWEWMVPALILVGLSLGVGFVAKHQRGRSILLLCCFGAWAAYVASVGGDIFAGRRHLVVLWLLLAFMVMPGLDWVVRRGRVWLTVVVAVLGLAMTARLGERQREDPKMHQAKTQIWQWEGEILARVLGEGFREEQPLLAVTAAGTLPYFSKLPSLDMLGLNDRHIARQRPEQAGSLAHDHADGAYVLDREPDLIVFTLGLPPRFAVGKQLRRDVRFKREYMPVVFRGYVPHEREGKVYVRTRGRVGMQVHDDLVTVPGYLLDGKGVFAQPGVDGGIEAVVPAGVTLGSRLLPLGPGTWRVTVDPPNPDLEVGLDVGNRRPAPILTVSGEQRVRLRVSSGEVSSLLGTIRVERVADTESTQAAVVEAPTYIVEPFGTFEDGLGTWRRTGRAFKSPASEATKRQKPVKGNVGKFLNSYDRKRGDRIKGQLTSEPFTVTAGMILSFRVGGGEHWRVGVRLMDGERTLMAWHGNNSEELAEVRFALTPYAGRSLHIEVFDESNGRWGHVLADEFMLLRLDEPAGP
jgi:arabinofuranosyltransferase